MEDTQRLVGGVGRSVTIAAARRANTRAGAERALRLRRIELGIDAGSIAMAALAVAVEESAGTVRTTRSSGCHRFSPEVYHGRNFAGGDTMNS
jgi:hypothetical protein